MQCYILITGRAYGSLRMQIMASKARVSHEFARIRRYANDMVMRKNPKFWVECEFSEKLAFDVCPELGNSKTRFFFVVNLKSKIN